MLAFLQNILNIILPPRCLLCGKILSGENGLCEDCFSKIKFISKPYCQSCGCPLPIATKAKTCPICVSDNKNPFRMQRARVYYDENSKPLLINFKFHDKTENAPFLAHWLLAAGHDIWEKGADVLIPVPLHKTRLRYRKYNQAALLCKELSKLTGIPVDYTSLKRHKKTKPQVECSKARRRNNVKNAFMLSSTENIKNKRVVIIDDVYTTGATLKECGLVLKSAGATSVDALTVARVLKE